MARNDEKRDYWNKHFEHWQASGLTQRAYCEREGLAISTFDHWRRKVLKQGRSEAAQSSAAMSPGLLTLVPVQVDVTEPGGIQLCSPGGWRVSLPATLDVTRVAQLLSSLP